MTRNLKVLGGVLLGLAAIVLLNASAASAVTDVFTTTKERALLTGVTHDSVVTLTGGSGLKVQCTTAKFAGTMVNGSTAVVADSEYTGGINQTPHSAACTTSIGTLTIDTNECGPTSTGATTGKDGGQVDAVIWMSCPAGKNIVVTSSLGLNITLPPQTPTEGGATFVNLPNHPGGAAIEAKGTFTGITYTCAPAFTCGLAGIPSHSDNMDITGTVIFTGYEDIDGLPTPVIEGARIPISVSSSE